MAKVTRVSYFMANLEDKTGALLKIIQDLNEKGLGLAGLWGFATREGKAQLYVVANDPDKLRNLWKTSGLLAEEGTAFLIKDTDRTGALIQPLEALARVGLNIRAIDAIAVGENYGSILWVDSTNLEKAAQALGAK